MYFRVNLKMKKPRSRGCFTWIVFIELNLTVAFLLIRKTWDDWFADNMGRSGILTLKHLFPDLSWKMMYKKYPVPGLVREFVPSTLMGLHLLKNGHTATYQGPHASEMIWLSHKSVAVMLSSHFCEKNGFKWMGKTYAFSE